MELARASTAAATAHAATAAVTAHTATAAATAHATTAAAYPAASITATVASAAAPATHSTATLGVAGTSTSIENPGFAAEVVRSRPWTVAAEIVRPAFSARPSSSAIIGARSGALTNDGRADAYRLVEGASALPFRTR